MHLVVEVRHAAEDVAEVVRELRMRHTKLLETMLFVEQIKTRQDRG